MKKTFYKKSNSAPTIVAAALALGFAAVPTLRAQVQQINPGVSAIIPYTQQVEIGPILDVVPYVLSDGYTINLTLIPSLTDFNGYDTPPAIANVTGSLNVVQLPVILPDFSIRQVVTTVNVWDNQTVVIGGLISSQVNSTSDKVPVLGDIPLVGNLFQSNSKSVTKKNLMIFVTAIIVDPAGNRVHSDDELPFAQSAIPPQPPGAGQMTETVQQVHSLPQSQDQ
jgi:type II secretory pathway component GspD/PulD (secretin)